MIKDFVKDFICNFDLVKDNYECKVVDKVNIFRKGRLNSLKIIATGNPHSNDVFVGENLTGNVAIKIQGNGHKIYIGDGCKLQGVTINIKGERRNVVIGNNVTSAGGLTIAVGQNAASVHSDVVIGDDVMFAKDCSVFTSDNHPIFDLTTFERINIANANVVIEPHVWVGQGATVTKAVTVGACSIIAAAAVVSKDIERFSLAAGIPAKVIKENVIWARHEGKESIEEAKRFSRKFGSE